MSTYVIYSDASDGRLRSTSTTYTNARSGTGDAVLLVTVDNTNASLGQAFSTPDYLLYEALLAFDTSTIVGTPLTASMSIVPLTSPLGAGTLEARLNDWGGTIETTDYLSGDAFAAATLLASKVQTSLPENVRTVLDSDAAFPGAINTSGFTRMVLSTSTFRLGTVPTTLANYNIFITETAGTASDPLLVVTTAVAAASGDILYPDSDVTGGSWTNEGASTLGLAFSVDEVSADDADYAQSPAGPTSSQYYEVALQTKADPVSSTGHIVHYRYRKNVAGGNVDLTVSLRQGSGTQIASWAHTNISNTWTTANQTLTGGQADAITNYSDLRLRFTPSTTTSDFVPTFVADRASANSNAAVTTVDLALTGLTVGNWLIIRTAADNSGGGGASRSLTVTNQTGTPIDTVTQLSYQQNNDPGAASAGVTCNVFAAPITATSGTVRLTYAGSVVQACVAEEWSGIDVTVPQVGQVGANGVASTNLASLTDTSIAAGNLAYATEAVEGPSTDTYTQDADTTNGTWSTLTKVGTTNATADTNMTTYGGYKVATAAGAQTYNPTINNARDSAGILVEFVVKAPTVRTQVSWANLELPAGAATTTVSATKVAAVAAVGVAGLQVGSTLAPPVVGGAVTVPVASIKTGATAAPPTVAGTTSIGAPSIQVGISVAPPVVSVAVVATIPTFQISQTVSAATVASVASVGATAIVTPTNATAGATTVAATATVGTPTEHAGASTAPPTVAGSASVGTAVLQAGQTVTPVTVATLASVGTTAPSASSTVAPVAVSAVGTVGVPGVSAAALVGAVVVNGQAAVGAPGVAASSTVPASTVNTQAAVGAPAVSVGSNAAVAPSPVPAVASVDSPAVTTGAGVAPASVSGAASVGAPTVQAGQAAGPATIAATTTIAAPLLETAGNVNIVPVTVPAPTTVGSPTVGAESVVAPPSVDAVASVGVPSVQMGAHLEPATIAALAAIGAPTVVTATSTTITPLTVGGISSVPATVVSLDTTVPASTVTLTALAPTPPLVILHLPPFVPPFRAVLSTNGATRAGVTADGRTRSPVANNGIQAGVTGDGSTRPVVSNSATRAEAPVG